MDLRISLLTWSFFCGQFMWDAYVYVYVIKTRPFVIVIIFWLIWDIWSLAWESLLFDYEEIVFLACFLNRLKDIAQRAIV